MAEKVEIVQDRLGMKDLVLTEEPSVAPIIPEPVEAAPQEQESTETQQEVVAEPEPTPVQESYSQKNFKALKTEAARLAKERDEYQALLRQYETEKKQRQVQAQVVESSDEDFDVDLDAGKDLKKLTRDVKAMKDELKRTQIRAQLISEHSDYEKVCSKENLETLELTKPHLARAINLNDPYNAGLACYELIKQFGIDSHEADKTEVTKALIKQNLAKPKVGAQVAGTKNTPQSPMGRMSEFYEGPITDEMKKIFYKELQEAMATVPGKRI